MNTFELYFTLGKEHILDYSNGYDHILFIIALCAIYPLRNWKKVLVLVTSFTIGHSITLALATLQIIMVNTKKIEFFIPVTIFITAFSHIFRKKEEYNTLYFQINYLFALLFGLIHGMGFSSYLQAILGGNQSITVPLLAFNLGLELGQLIIVIAVMIVSYILVDVIGVSRSNWRLVISSGIAGAALVLAKDNVFW